MYSLAGLRPLLGSLRYLSSPRPPELSQLGCLLYERNVADMEYIEAAVRENHLLPVLQLATIRDNCSRVTTLL